MSLAVGNPALYKRNPPVQMNNINIIEVEDYNSGHVFLRIWRDGLLWDIIKMDIEAQKRFALVGCEQL